MAFPAVCTPIKMLHFVKEYDWSSTAFVTNEIVIDVCGSVHHSIFHIKKIQQDATVYQNFLFHFYMKLNVFRATHRPSSGA